MSKCDNTEPKPSHQCTDILLPQGNWVLQIWKVRPGSLVRKGETVALACYSDRSNASAPVSPPEDDNVVDSMVKHKRPNRRRGVVPSASVALKATTNSYNSFNTRSSDPIASIQQRIAEKLKATKDDVKEPASDEPSSSSEGPLTKDANIPILAPATGILRTSTISNEAKISRLSIGYIEECMHPAFLEGICVVCGHAVTRNPMELDEDHDEQDDEDETNRHEPKSATVPLPSFDVTKSERSSKASQVTVSGGVTMTVSAEESRLLAQQDTQRLLQHAKLSLVLDLDHTLVHATADPRAQQFHGRDDVRSLRLPLFEGTNNIAVPPGTPMFMQHYVKLRPHIKSFLQSVQPDYELTVYTAGTRQYAEEITIVLCRHMVGSTRDADDLERLRYNVHLAKVEFQRIQSLSQTTIEQQPDKQTNSGNVNEREIDDSIQEYMATGDEAEPAARKRKRVSFGAPQDDNSQEELDDSKVSAVGTGTKPPKSDHMTKGKLEALCQELADAEELEKKAWELRQKLFGSRVVSRTDVADLGRDVKSLKRIFPCGGTMAAVVDDREDVWANAADNSHDTIKGEPPRNLLLVRPYHWQRFIGFADVNNVAGDDLSGNQPGNNSEGDPNVEHDVQLIWTSRILRGLHRRFYRQDMKNRKTVPELLAEMRSQVLQDATLVLSGLVPLHKKSTGTNEARLPIVRFAQSLGAKLVDNVEPGVTHVVAAKDGTDKCFAARKTPGCVLVKASWLVECYWSMTRRDVKPHLMDSDALTEESTGSTINKATTDREDGKVENSTNTDASDVSSSMGSDDEDDFAATFEDEMMNT